MKYHTNILDIIGGTPLVKLNKVGEGVKATLLAKLEYLNPGGSVKDRIGIAMVEDAERRGLLRPGGVIVEPTSGNTGMGLALAAAVKGYGMVFTMPDKMSEEKRRLLRALGGRVVVTPTNLPPGHPESYIEVAKRIAAETPGAYMSNQYVNPHNPRIHYETTGPEIWDQTGGRIDVFVAGMGTGGTITGVGRYLKEKNPKVRVVGVDPEGSLIHHEFYGKEGPVHTYKVEGIGEDFLPTTLDLGVVDEVITVGDKEAFLAARRLAREEGLLVGGSSGSAVYAALQVAEGLGEGKVVVVLLPDTGRNYLSKIYSEEWMVEHGFIERAEGEATVGEVLASKPRRVPALVTIAPEASLEEAASLMRTHGISQLPVLKEGVPVGLVTEVMLMRRMMEGGSNLNHRVSAIMEKPPPRADSRTGFGGVFKPLLEDHVLLVEEGGRIVGLIAVIDVVNYLSTKKGVEG